MDHFTERIALVVLGLVVISALAFAALVQIQTGRPPSSLLTLAASALGALAAVVGARPPGRRPPG